MRDVISTLLASFNAGPSAAPSVLASKGKECVTTQNDAEFDRGDEEADAGDVNVIDNDVADIGTIKSTDGDDSIELNRAGSDRSWSPSWALESRSDRRSSINDDNES